MFVQALTTRKTNKIASNKRLTFEHT